MIDDIRIGCSLKLNKSIASTTVFQTSSHLSGELEELHLQSRQAWDVVFLKNNMECQPNILASVSCNSIVVGADVSAINAFSISQQFHLWPSNEPVFKHYNFKSIKMFEIS